MKKPKADKLFATEADLCAAFIASIDADKWIPYPETAGWDILLVRNVDGFQIGIQAKQKLNTDVINQALDEYGHWSAARAGPDCRALLVPSSNGLGYVCKYLGLEVVTPIQIETWGRRKGLWRFDPSLPAAPPSYQSSTEWAEWAPAKRHKLPDYIPDVIAGASSPTQLTDWKIKALKLWIMLERNGGVIRADFAHLQLDHRRWVEGGWLQRDGDKFVAGPKAPNFHKAHPRVYKEIDADFARWAPKASAKQETLGL